MEVSLPDARSALIPGYGLLSEEPSPRQLSDVYRITVDCKIERPGCPADVYFNFYSPRRIEVTLDMGLAAFIILLMIFVSANLQQTLHKLVVQPMASWQRKRSRNALNTIKCGRFRASNGAECSNFEPGKYALGGEGASLAAPEAVRPRR